MISPAKWEGFTRSLEGYVERMPPIVTGKEKDEIVSKLLETIRTYLEADLENVKSLPDVVTQVLRTQSNLTLDQKSNLHDFVTRLTVVSFSPLLASKKFQNVKAGAS